MSIFRKDDMLLKKSKENSTAAVLLHENKMYNSVVHCAYYSCYQQMVKINGDATKHKIGKNSHEKVINFFNKEVTNKKRLIAFDFYKNIKWLKDLRHTADYNKTIEISPEESEESIKSSKLVLEILDQVFKD